MVVVVVGLESVIFAYDFFHLTWFSRLLLQRQEEAKARAEAELANLNEDVLKRFGDAPLIQSQTISNKVNTSCIHTHEYMCITLDMAVSFSRFYWTKQNMPQKTHIKT